MKTPIVALLLASLAIAGTAAACPLAEDPVGSATGVAACVASIVGPDGQDEQVGNVDTGVDVIDQQHPCTT